MKKRSIFILCLVILGFILIGSGTTYSLLTTNVSGEKSYVIKTGELTLHLDESKNLSDIIEDGELPMPDSYGILKDGYQFSLVNDEKSDLTYEVYLVADEVEKQIPADKIKIYIKTPDNKENIIRLDETLVNDMYVIATGIISTGTTQDFLLKMWIDYDAGNEILGCEFSSHIEIEATQYFEDKNFEDTNDGKNDYQIQNKPSLIKPSKPIANDKMILVKYDNDKNSWVKTTEGDNWSDYENQIWGNAVTVYQDKYEDYKTVENGTIIKNEDIETMWVWIPRYEYKIIEKENIDIKFISTSTTADSEYIIPQAFTFDGKELSGIWVGKFETSSSNYSLQNGGGNTTDLTARIIPGVISWRDISISNMVQVAKNMTTTDNIYGFLPTYDIHVIKSSEWAAVAYLSTSKYGKLGNPNYTANEKEVCRNSSYSYETGTTTYKTSYVEAQCASTTGNVTGVYDMAGGANEINMSNYNRIVSSSNLTSEWLDENTKYYDEIISKNIKYAPNSLAFKETLNWYNDEYSYVEDYAPWIVRGGAFYNNSGIYSFYNYNGDKNPAYGFRLTLVK